MWLLKTSVAGNATRQWLLIAMCHVVLYDVKKKPLLPAKWNFIFTKVVKFDFSHSKLRKQRFVAEILKIHGGPWTLFRRPCPYICNVCEFLGTNYCISQTVAIARRISAKFASLAQTSSHATACNQSKNHVSFFKKTFTTHVRPSIFSCYRIY